MAGQADSLNVAMAATDHALRGRPPAARPLAGFLPQRADQLGRAPRHPDPRDILRSRLAAEMSNQWSLASSDAMNRVIGGSPRSRRAPQAASQAAPSAAAAPRGIRLVTRGSPRPASSPLIQSQRTTGSPFVMKYARPPAGEPGEPRAASAARCASAAFSTWTMSTRFLPSPTIRSRPARARGEDPWHKMRVARAPDQVRAERDRRQPRRMRREHLGLGGGLGQRVGAWATGRQRERLVGPGEVAAVVDHAWRAGVDKPADAVRPAARDHGPRPEDVGAEEISHIVPRRRPWPRRERPSRIRRGPPGRPRRPRAKPG